MHSSKSLFLFILIILLNTFCMAQTWQTSSGDPNNIYYNNGFVGIGVSNPQDLLHLNKVPGGSGIRLGIDVGPNIITLNTVNFANEIQGGFITVNSQCGGYPNWVQTSTDQYSGAMFMRLGAAKYEVRFGDATNSGGDNPGDAIFTVEPTRFRVHKNLGIGINPVYKLHVFNYNADVQAAIETNMTKGNAILSLINGTQEWKIVNNVNDDFCIRDQTGLHTPVVLENGAPECSFKISSNGSVCIGTTNPDAYSKLTVAGKISAQDITIKADAGGADFVFEKDYALPPLDHVEQFVKDNKHLPDIPSAQEMQENGVHISEMQTRLLQKIEEITLYMIEMKKENMNMKNEISTLKSRINELEK